MPEISPLGWFHTGMGIIALVSGGLTLARFKEITLQSGSGKIYLVTTLITASTALAIFQHGEFGPGHALAIMTMAALIVGMATAFALGHSWKSDDTLQVSPLVDEGTGLEAERSLEPLPSVSLEQHDYNHGFLAGRTFTVQENN